MGDAEAVDHTRITYLRIALLGATIATFALLYVPQAVLPQLADEFDVSPGASTLVISTATAGVAVAGIPLAMLSEVVGRRTMMIAALCVATAAGLLLAVVPSFTALLVLRAIQGMALAGVPAVAMAHVADELQGAALGTSMGIYVAGTTVGGMSGRIVGGVLGDVAGWRVGLAAVGVLAAVATVAFAVLLPQPRPRTAGPGPVRAVVTGLRRALSDPVLYGPYLVAMFGMGAFVAVYNVLPFRLVRPP
ncbi:MAG: MFS transporter, partial [Streptosporangiales bacterium]